MTLTQKLSPKYFFLSLGVLVTLIASVVSFLNLVFETLNKKFPDVLNAAYQYGYNTFDYENMRSALATLIIIFPVFLIISYFWCRQSERGLGSIDEIIRRWVIYLILFLSSIVIIADLVTLVKYFVAGEITTRFILKVATTLIIALLVGLYYILELKLKDSAVAPAKAGKQGLSPPAGRAGIKDKAFAIGVVFGSVGLVLFLTAIIWSFMVMGSPAKQRLLRLDDRRIQDLQNIQWQVINFWQQKEKLPEALKDLKDPLSGYSLPVDPDFEKGINYEYAKKDKIKFELCATFSLSMPKGWREWSNDGTQPMPLYEKGMAGGSDVSTNMIYPYPGPGGTNESWDHETGRTCFERTIDPEIYPPFRQLK